MAIFVSALMSNTKSRSAKLTVVSTAIGRIAGETSAWRRRQGGYTLVEVMISSVILALAILSSMAVLSQCTTYIADMRLRARSAQILQQQIENMRLLSWASLQSLPSTFSDPTDTNNVYIGTISNSTYQSYGTTATVLRVTAQVTWTNMHNRIMTNSMTSLFSKGGINNTS